MLYEGSVNGGRRVLIWLLRTFFSASHPRRKPPPVDPPLAPSLFRWSSKEALKPASPNLHGRAAILVSYSQAPTLCSVVQEVQ